MRRKKWHLLNKADFLERIGSLMKQGYTLANSLELYGLNEKPHVRQIIEQMLEQLQEGDPLYDVLERYGFPSDTVSTIYFFEYDNLPEGLIHSGKALRKREQLKQKLDQLLQYPLFLLWLAAILIYMMTRYIFPQFTMLFSSTEDELPTLTNMMIRLIEVLPIVFLVILGTAVFISIYYFTRFRKQSPTQQITGLLKIPFINSMTRLVLTHRFSISFSTLLQAGTSINEAINIFERQTHSLFFQQEAAVIKLRLQSGESLEEIMRSRPAFTPELSAVIRHGHLNGQLADELSVYAHMLFDKIEAKMQKFFRMLQPVIFAVIGALILLMFLAMMLPLLQYIQML